MSSTATLKWIGLALLGLAIAIAVAVVASNLASRQIGLAAEPLSAGNALAPAASRARGGNGSGAGGNGSAPPTVPSATPPPPAEATSPTTPATEAEPPRDHGGDSHGGERGGAGDHDADD